MNWKRAAQATAGVFLMFVLVGGYMWALDWADRNWGPLGALFVVIPTTAIGIGVWVGWLYRHE